jgi:RND family efflux transporter MFP subunit
MLGMEGMGATPGMAAPSGAVYISPARQQLIGVRTAEVKRQSVGETTRTVGTLAYDETRITEIHPKVTGWVNKVYADYVGKSVRRGQPLFDVYSQTVVATENELIVALRAQRQLSPNVQAYDRSSTDLQVSATRSRLLQWDVPAATIDEIERTGTTQKYLTFVSPFDGIVLERNVYSGRYINPDQATYKIADLSTIWALGEIFEYEAPQVHVGQTVQVEFPYGQSSRAIEGKISFIAPNVDPQTRRVKIRAEVPNPRLELKAETFITIVIRGHASEMLLVSKEAIIDTGSRRYAFLALPDGYFEPRTVDVGTAVGDYYPVNGGLAAGDRVVTSAQFLVDSESNLKAAMQNMAMSMPGMDMGDQGANAPPPKPAAPAPKPTPSPRPAPSPSSTPSTTTPMSTDMPDMPGMPGMHSGH